MGNGASEFQEFEDLNPNFFPKTDGKTISLPDGRCIGYAVFGQQEQSKIVLDVLFIPGDPGYRFSFPKTHHEESVRAGLRVFVLERPGSGLSTPKEDFTLLSVAADFKQAAERLGLLRYAVVGYSAGGPFALACGAQEPRDQISSITLISSVGPPETPNIYKNMALTFRLGWWSIKHWQWGVRQFTKMESANFADHPRQSLREQFHIYDHDTDFARYTEDENVEKLFLEAALDHASRPHTEEAQIHMLLQFGKPWGFDFAEFQVPVLQFAGLRDKGSVPSIADYFESALPDCATTRTADAGHLLFFDIWEQVSEAIVKKWKLQQR
uniref:AB hydrolase-1 domain-containing protein n=1 Tax=Fibrocapsa japonica TaxID=94617 RepID=A0A7S2Y298_9STRA